MLLRKFEESIYREPELMMMMLNDDDDSFIPNGSSISNINGDINDKKAMLEAQRKELTESIIEGL